MALSGFSQSGINNLRDFTGTNQSFMRGQTKTADGRTIRRDGTYQYVYDRNGNLISKTLLNKVNTGSNPLAQKVSPKGAGNTTYNSGANVAKVSPAGAGNSTYNPGTNVAAASPAGAGNSTHNRDVSSAQMDAIRAASGGSTVPTTAQPLAGIPAGSGTSGDQPLTGWLANMPRTDVGLAVENPELLAAHALYGMGLDPMGRNAQGFAMMSPFAAAAPMAFQLAMGRNMNAASNPALFDQNAQGNFMADFMLGTQNGPGSARTTFGSAPSTAQFLQFLSQGLQDPTSQLYADAQVGGDMNTQMSFLMDLINTIGGVGSSSLQQQMLQNRLAQVANNYAMRLLTQGSETIAPLAEFFLNSIGVPTTVAMSGNQDLFTNNGGTSTATSGRAVTG